MPRTKFKNQRRKTALSNLKLRLNDKESWKKAKRFRDLDKDPTKEEIENYYNYVRDCIKDLEGKVDEEQ